MEANFFLVQKITFFQQQSNLNRKKWRDTSSSNLNRTNNWRFNDSNAIKKACKFAQRHRLRVECSSGDFAWNTLRYEIRSMQMTFREVWMRVRKLSDEGHKGMRCEWGTKEMTKQTVEPIYNRRYDELLNLFIACINILIA